MNFTTRTYRVTFRKDEHLLRDKKHARQELIGFFRDFEYFCDDAYDDRLEFSKVERYNSWPRTRIEFSESADTITLVFTMFLQNSLLLTVLGLGALSVLVCLKTPWVGAAIITIGIISSVVMLVNGTRNLQEKVDRQVTRQWKTLRYNH